MNILVIRIWKILYVDLYHGGRKKGSKNLKFALQYELGKHFG